MSHDTAASSAITDHAFVAPDGEPWGRCAAVTYPPLELTSEPQSYPKCCGLAQSAHQMTMTPYVTDAKRRDNTG